MDSAFQEIENKSKRSIKWSFFGELIAKIAVPLSTMVLARLLTPNDYGIATAVTIIISFCETVCDSGFAKYLVQHEFQTKEEYTRCFSMSLFVSLILSIIGCLAVILLRNPLSSIIGNKGYEMVLVVSSLQLPFAAINALFTADLRRKFGFKKIFITRIIQCIIPFFITIPLAFFGLSYWALVIGTISTTVIFTPFLILFSKQKVVLFFSFRFLRLFLGASFAMILESIVIWLCTWANTFVAARLFDQSFVGIVKVSQSTVTTIFSIFSSSFLNVLFPTLSRFQNDEEHFSSSFFSIQSIAFLICTPIAIGGLLYSDLITTIFLGSEWQSASKVIGIFFLAQLFHLCFNNFLSEVFRSKGHFYSSTIYQIVSFIIEILVLFFIGRRSTLSFILASLLCKIIRMVICLFIIKFKYRMSLKKQFKSLMPSFLCSLPMIASFAFTYRKTFSFKQSIGQVIACAIIYFSFIRILFPSLLNNALVIFKRK